MFIHDHPQLCVVVYKWRNVCIFSESMILNWTLCLISLGKRSNRNGLKNRNAITEVDSILVAPVSTGGWPNWMGWLLCAPVQTICGHPVISLMGPNGNKNNTQTWSTIVVMPIGGSHPGCMNFELMKANVEKCFTCVLVCNLNLNLWRLHIVDIWSIISKTLD